MTARLASFLLLVLSCVSRAAGETFYCCNAGDPQYLGEYKQEEDGMKYTNANGRSLFTNEGFWYLGDTSGWPPETHYRCVGCPAKDKMPPLTGYKPSSKGTSPAPEFQTE